MPDAGDRAAPLMDELDPRLLRLIRTRVNSFIKWDLVRYFHDNPRTADTPDSIARRIGRDVRIVEPELQGLARDGVLLAEDLGDLIVYSLGQDAEVVRLLDDFITASADRQFRIKAIYHVIRGLR
jgi:hypothetical protein